MQRYLRLIALVTILVTGVVCLIQAKIRSDITAFLPFDDGGEAELIRTLTAAPLNRVITFVIEDSDEEQAKKSASEIISLLKSREEIDWIRSGDDEVLEQSIYEIYFPHRFAFSDPLQKRDKAWMSARAEFAKRQLQSPVGAFVGKLLPRDPALLFLDHLESMRGEWSASLTPSPYGFVDKDGARIIFAATKVSAFETKELRSLIDELNAKTRTLNERGGKTYFASITKVALATEDAIRSDINRVSILSSIAVIALILLLFRSFPLLFLGTMPIAAGGIVGAATTQLIFGEIHGLTVAFGVTLIGVAIDYIVHFFSHYSAETEQEPRKVIRHIRPALFLGAGTTITGLAALALAGFAGLSQMSLFSSVGVAVALLVTLFILPDWMPKKRTTPALQTKVANLIMRTTEQPKYIWVVLIAFFVASAIGWPSFSVSDDIRALSVVDQAIEDEQAQVQSRLGGKSGARLVIAEGVNLDEALERSEAFQTKMRPHGVTLRSLGHLLRSSALQSRATASWTTQSGELLRETFASQGFSKDALTPFITDLQAQPKPLTLSKLENSPLRSMLDSFIIEGETKTRVLSLLSDPKNAESVSKEAQESDSVRYLDQGRALSKAYQTFRERTFRLVLIGTALIFLIALIRYRSLRASLLVLGPAILALIGTYGFLALIGEAFNLMHLLASILVLSIGVDYGVFILEGGAKDKTTNLSLVIAAISTIFSFGLLGMSMQPSMRAIGLTTGVGVLATLLLVLSLQSKLNLNRNQSSID